MRHLILTGAITASMAVLGSGAEKPPASLLALGHKVGTACVTLIDPLGGSVQETKQSVKLLFSKWKTPPWAMGVEAVDSGYIVSYSKHDDLDGSDFIFRVELKKIPNKLSADTCGPERVFLTRLFYRRGENTGILGGQEASAGLLQMPP